MLLPLRKSLGILLACSCISFSALAQRYTISGYMKDAATGETLPGAAFTIKELNKGAVTNEYGFYSISIPPGKYTGQITYLGYRSVSDTFNLTKNIRRNFSLQSNATITKEVVVTAESAKKNIESTQMGTEQLSMEQIKTLPVILGEVDLLKTLQLLPGVQSSGEGNSGFYVRGGGPDQNLILLDEATVYNSGHLFGFFSVFNSDAISNVTLIKGGMPASYGGRLSSVVDVKMKEGNNQRFAVTGGVGLIASRLTVEGPLKKNKSSFIVSGRRTYIDVLTLPLRKNSDNAATANSGYYFFDLNAKLNYTFSDKDRLYLSGYFGRDKFTFGGERFTVNFPWGNATASSRWNHLFNDKLFMNATAIFSDYTFELGAGQNGFNLKLFSGIRDYTLKLDFDYYPSPRHSIRYGTYYSYHIFTPSTVTGKIDSVDLSPEKINRQYGNEAAVYVLDDFELNKRIRINAGLRFSAFQQIGPYDRFIEQTDGSFDTIPYKSGQNIALYGGLEPRLSIRFALDEFSSIKASYTRTHQYLHLASTSGSTLPADLWIPSSQRVKPQRATQYAIGYFRNFSKDRFESSVEVYYKDLSNQIEFKEGRSPGFSPNVENDFTFGAGKSYGVEFFLKKRVGKFNGWIGYTHAYAKRSFPDINDGEDFYAKYDRRHDGSMVLSYTLSKRWTFGSVFVYGSGSAFSAPASYAFISNTPGLYYADDYRNKYRLLPYHRLDLSATLTAKKTAKFESSFNFSIYNVYNRQNQYIIFLEQEGNVNTGGIKTKVKQITVFPIIPSVTWNFSF